MLFLILLAALPFALPIVSLVSLATVRRRLAAAEELLEQQRQLLRDVERRVQQLGRETTDARAHAAPSPSAAPVAAPAIPSPPPAAAPPVVNPAAPEVRPPAQAPPAAIPTPPIISAPARPTPPPPVVIPPPAAAPPARVAAPPTPPPLTLPPPPEPFDWERLVGVRMFSAVSGIALVLAAVFFLRYSIDHGWLAPPVRFVIGLITGIGLLVVCELKVARNYRITTNSLDAAAIAILFATFFAAHALWHLIPSGVAFGFMALVTATAVLLSLRRDSLFIAVLGLLGGFATPALLSTGENRPISLFTYLLLLNIGLAWVATRRRWSVLTVCTLAFTTLYQWGWVIRFLSVGQLSLAMGIFVVFAVMGFVSLTFGTRTGAGGALDRTLERSGLVAATMPLLFGIYLSAVPAYGASAGLLFGFMLLIDVALAAVAIGRGDELAHAIGATATLAVFAIWLAVSYVNDAWPTAVAFTAASVALFLAAPVVAERLGRPFTGVGARAVYAAPALLFVFVVIARLEPAVASPWGLFAPLFGLLALLTWRALATGNMPLYFIAAFFGLVAEAAWSAVHLTLDHLRAALQLYAAFAAFYLGVPLVARRLHRPMTPAWGSGAVLIASLLMLLYLASAPASSASLWGLAVLLAILDGGIFIESAAGALPLLSAIGAGLSWLVLAVWWGHASAAVGVMPSLLALLLITLVMLSGYAWSYTQAHEPAIRGSALPRGTYLGLGGYLFLFFVAVEPQWSTPPWPLLGALAVMTLAVSTASLTVKSNELHAGGVVLASVVIFAWSAVSAMPWAPAMLVAAEIVAAYALAWLRVSRGRGAWNDASAAAACALVIANLTLGQAAGTNTPVAVALIAVTASVNLGLVFAVAWSGRWNWVAPAAVVSAWYVQSSWHNHHSDPAAWGSSFVLGAALYAVCVAYPLVLGRRARASRDPYVTAIAGSAWFFFAARTAMMQGGLAQFVGAVPVLEGAVMTVLLRQLLAMETVEARDLGRLALVAGTALAFATVAIPLQLRHQWITIGWALEGTALAWLYRRIRHRGLLLWSVTLLAIVFVRLAVNPEVFGYEARGARIFNWYLYTYLIAGASMLLSAFWLSTTEDRIVAALPRASALLPAAGVILLFLLLNIEIADFFATGQAIAFRFGVTIAQDLTYTIGWLLFGLGLLTAGIYLRHRAGRVTAIALIAVTACKGFLYDMGSLGGLYRVSSLVGLAISLSLVALALQRFVLHASEDHA